MDVRPQFTDPESGLLCGVYIDFLVYWLPRIEIYEADSSAS